MQSSVVISCEHAGNEIPEEYRFLFGDRYDVIDSHRGWDPGAYAIAEYLAEHLQCALYSCHTSRLLVEANRSINSSELFSEFSRPLSQVAKQKLLSEIYYPYRQAVEAEIIRLPGPVLHLSIHSFTPIWKGLARTVDIGLLFDPNRALEAKFCEAYRQNLQELLPRFRIAFNEPYHGTDDGLTTYLRTRFSQTSYIGIEIEVNQKFVGKHELSLIQAALCQAL